MEFRKSTTLHTFYLTLTTFYIYRSHQIIKSARAKGQRWIFSKRNEKKRRKEPQAQTAPIPRSAPRSFQSDRSHLRVHLEELILLLIGGGEHTPVGSVDQAVVDLLPGRNLQGRRLALHAPARGPAEDEGLVQGTSKITGKEPVLLDDVSIVPGLELPEASDHASGLVLERELEVRLKLGESNGGTHKTVVAVNDNRVVLLVHHV